MSQILTPSLFSSHLQSLPCRLLTRDESDEYFWRKRGVRDGSVSGWVEKKTKNERDSQKGVGRVVKKKKTQVMSMKYLLRQRVVNLDSVTSSIQYYCWESQARYNRHETACKSSVVLIGAWCWELPVCNLGAVVRKALWKKGCQIRNGKIS